MAVNGTPLVPLLIINQCRSFPYLVEVMQFAGIYPNTDFHQHQQGSFPDFSQSQQILSECLCNCPKGKTISCDFNDVLLHFNSLLGLLSSSLITKTLVAVKCQYYRECYIQVTITSAEL